MLEVGATDEADALFWLALSAAVLGAVRLVAGPIWGLLADRIGRKAMFLRALFLTGVCNVMTGAIGEPWHLPIVYALLGLFSGYIPASVALTSVSVPDSRISSSLSIVTSAQYLGNSIGPIVGSLLIIFLDYRGAIFVGAVFPMLAAIAVLFVVPNDRPRRSERTASASEAPPLPLEPFRPSFQLILAIGVYFVIFAASQLIRLLSPVALKDINPGNIDQAIGLTFTVGGLASALSLIVLAPRFYRTGEMQKALVASSGLGAAFLVIMALAGSVPIYVLGFALYSLVQAAMIPAANTLIAGNVSRSRRGTAFGLASSAHALAFMIGPFGAALFAGVSIGLGFIVTAGILLLLGLLLLAMLREPSMVDTTGVR